MEKHRELIFLSVAVVATATFVSEPAAAADPPGEVSARPRVGLVLSGGGARGAAHIGVIRILEEYRIPVDVIAGTSIGAIVGGLYAAGLNGDELEAVLTGIDWSDALQDKTRRQSLSFRRKQDDENFLVKFDLGVSGTNFRLPKGLVQGQKLSLILNRHLMPVAHIRDFDKLPIPFRAVATDIETGKAVVLKSGSLPRAMRASMAAPGVFSPVEIDGRLLVDGGLANNLPVKVAQDLGVDVLIVVDISFPLLSREKLDSALEISNQTLTIFLRNNADAQLKLLSPGDVTIFPDLGNMGSSNFSQSADAVRAGEQAARDALPQLAALSLNADDYRSYVAQRRSRQNPPPVIDYVAVVDKSRLSPQLVRSRLKVPIGETLDSAKLERDIANIYGVGTYERVDYQIQSGEDEATGLVVEAVERSWGPNYVNFGLNLQDDFEGSSSFNLAARYTKTQVNLLGAEWRTDVQVGENQLLFTEFFQPLDFTSGFFVAPQLKLQEFNGFLFADDERTAEIRISSAEAGIDFGRQFGNWGEVRVGLRHAAGSFTPRTGVVELPTSNFQTGNVALSFSYDKLDNVNFPREGTQGFIEWKAYRASLGSSRAAENVEASILRAYTAGHSTWLGSFSAGTNVRGAGEIQQSFSLGGLFNLSGFRNGQLTGQHFALGRMVYYREIGGNVASTFNSPFFAGGSVEIGNVWDDSSEIDFNTLLLSGSVFLGLDTFLGPMYLAYGIGENSNSAAYFLLGRSFR